MVESPFAIFAPFTGRIRVHFLSKPDAVFSDEDTARVLGIPITKLTSLEQVHGSKTIRVTSPQIAIPSADGAVTDLYGVTLVSRSADCQSFVAFDPVKNVIGTLHIGWRGLLAGGIEEFFRILKQEWKCEAKDILIGAAPSLCKNCAEFTDPKKELPEISDGFTSGRCVDLIGIADKKLKKLGVTKSHFERMNGCTKCQPDSFWSYRGPDREEVLKGARNVLAVELLK